MPGSGNKISGEPVSEASSGFSFPVMPSPNDAQGARAEFFSVEHGERAAAHGGGVDDDGMSDDGSESTTWSVLADATAQAAQALLDIQSHGSGPRGPARRSLDAMKVVATPDAAAAGLPGVSAEMEALLSMMDESDNASFQDPDHDSDSASGPALGLPPVRTSLLEWCWPSLLETSQYSFDYGGQTDRSVLG